MKSINTLKIELIFVVITFLLCGLLFIFDEEPSNFDSLSWSLISKKLLAVQEQCRNARAIRKVDNSIELIAADGDLLILSIENSESKQSLSLERRSLTRVKKVSTIKNLSKISLDFQSMANGLQDQDLTLKAIYREPASDRTLAVLIDLSLSDPRLIQELQL